MEAESRRKRAFSNEEDDEPIEKRKLREQPRRDYAEMQRLELKDPLTLLDKKNNSSDMKAEWVHYFLHVAYKAMGKGVSLIGASVEECLQHMFNFVSDDSNDFLNILVAQEIKQSCLKSKSYFKWLMDHDVLDWKSCKEKEKSDAILYFTEEVDKVAKLNEGAENVNAAIYIKSVLKSYVKLDDSTKKDGEGSGKHKFITRYMEALGHFLTSDYLRNGYAEIEFPLCIKRTDVDVHDQDRHVKIVTKPDGVFTHDQNKSAWWKVIVEIYGPCQKSFLALQQMQTTEKRRGRRSSRSHSPGIGLGRASPSPQRSGSVGGDAMCPGTHRSRLNKNRRGSHSNIYQSPVFSPKNFPASTSSSGSEISSLLPQSDTEMSDGLTSFGQKSASNQTSIPLNFSAFSHHFGNISGQASTAKTSKIPSNVTASDSGYLSGQTSSSKTHKEESESNSLGVDQDSSDKIAPGPSDNVDPCEIEIEKPVRTRKGIIVDQNYKSQARRYIENSLPQQCLEHHCVDKMAGQHVMQLFCEAMVNMTFSQKNSQKAIGMFVVNEYIYFSRLDVDNEQLKLINGDRYYHQLDLDDKLDEKFLEGKEPVVQYSNFRLDITKPNHRMALIIFLIRYVYSEEK